MILKSKGLTLLEIVIVIVLLSIILSFFFSVFDYANFFKKSRDNKRIADLWSLEMALRSYLMLSNNSLLLGPTNTSIGESEPSIFISVPLDIENLNSLILSGYHLKQVSSSDVMNIDGKGWLPVDLHVLINPPLAVYPVDPINSYNKKLFYSYIFKRSNSTFEINANLEFPEYKKGGSIDQTSSDGGDNDDILEVGNDKNLMINNLY